MLTLFLPVESTARELDYKLNLARHFCSKGFEVLIGNPPFIRDELKYKNYRGVFLEKGVNPDPDYYKRLADKGIYLYDLGDEGAAEPVYSINYNPAVDALKLMRKIFLWGESQKKDLINRNPEPILQEKYNVIGNPAFDLCMPKYKPFNASLKPKNFPDTYILINTNFGCIQSYDIDAQLEACTLISPLSKQMMEEGYKKEEEQFSVFQKWLENIIQAFPNEQFIIRPHPTEIKKNYEIIFGRYKNVLISKEGNVNYVISAAKLLLHKDCSTAMQSYLMGVPSISLGGRLLYKDYVEWPLNFSALPEDINEAKAIIDQILKTGKFRDNLQSEIDKKAKNILNNFFCNLGESTAALVNIITKDAEDLIKNPSSYKVVDSRSAFQKLKLYVRKFLPLHYKIPKATRETLIEFTQEDIMKRLALLESVNPLDIKFSVRKIFPNVFQVFRR